MFRLSTSWSTADKTCDLSDVELGGEKETEWMVLPFNWKDKARVY